MSAVFVVTRGLPQTLAAALSNGSARLRRTPARGQAARLKDRGRDGTDSCALAGAGEVEGGEQGGVGRGERG